MEYKNELSNVYSEVYKILSLMEPKYVDMIPEKLIDLIKREKNENYVPNIKINLPLDEQGLERKTLAFLAMLNLNYWCEDEKEKQDLLKIYYTNDERAEADLREKYNPDNIFKKKKQVEIHHKLKQKNMQMIEYNEKNILQRIMKKIMKFFKKE
mgnify:CR=1 FL=1